MPSNQNGLTINKFSGFVTPVSVSHQVFFAHLKEPSYFVRRFEGVQGFTSHIFFAFISPRANAHMQKVNPRKSTQTWVITVGFVYGVVRR